ncbi:MAG: hypothetical protein Tsb0015_03490 [Simkaniaceae bacterium]
MTHIDALGPFPGSALNIPAAPSISIYLNRTWEVIKIHWEEKPIDLFIGASWIISSIISIAEFTALFFYSAKDEEQREKKLIKGMNSTVNFSRFFQWSNEKQIIELGIFGSKLFSSAANLGSIIREGFRCFKDMEDLEKQHRVLQDAKNFTLEKNYFLPDQMIQSWLSYQTNVIFLLFSSLSLAGIFAGASVSTALVLEAGTLLGFGFLGLTFFHAILQCGLGAEETRICDFKLDQNSRRIPNV